MAKKSNHALSCKLQLVAIYQLVLLGQQGVEHHEFCKSIQRSCESLEKGLQFRLLSLYMQTVHLLS